MTDADRQTEDDPRPLDGRKTTCESRILWFLAALVLLFVSLVVVGLICEIPIETARMYWGHVWKVQGYFSSLEKDGWQVQVSAQPAEGGIKVRQKEVWAWLARPSSDQEWVSYGWILMPDEPSSVEELRSLGVDTNGWWKNYGHRSGSRAIFLPATEAALRVHKELLLPLPANFSVTSIQSLYTQPAK